MPEKNFSWNNAALVWWFITWRSAAVMLTLTIAASLFATYVNISGLVAGLLDWGLIIIGIALQILFIKIAINRTYRDFSGPKFHLQAVAVDTETSSTINQITEQTTDTN